MLRRIAGDSQDSRANVSLPMGSGGRLFYAKRLFEYIFRIKAHEMVRAFHGQQPRRRRETVPPPSRICTYIRIYELKIFIAPHLPPQGNDVESVREIAADQAGNVGARIHGRI